jgi:outer membrane protein assembly factor BamB
MKWNYDRDVNSTYSFISGYSRIIGTVKDASYYFDINVTIPEGLPGRIATVFVGNKVIGANIGDTQTTVWGLSLETGKEGTLLFNETWDNPTDWIIGNQTLSWEAYSPEVGVLWAMEGRQHYGVSFETGELMWGPTPSQNYRDQYYLTGSLITYGNLYASGLGGTLYCYNISTGELQWNCDIPDKYFEFKISPNWWLYNVFAADGKLYVGHYERFASDPKPRGAPFICFNATTGDTIWRIDGAFRQTMWGCPAIIGDSIIATMDTYDQRIYAIGKGPSATTVTAPDIGVSLGSSIIIKGTVTDRSPGTESYALKARFPNGVPAIADEHMSEWMLYVYKQFPCPAYTEGVEVILETFDSDGEYREIGRITSDSSGFYSLRWKPPAEGKYLIVARFEGTESYWGSYAETAISVDPASSPRSTIQPEPTVLGITEIAIIATLAFFILSTVAYWILRNKKNKPAKNMC